MGPVLEISHLTKHFGKLTAVQDVSFTVERGNVYGLLGPNGSGKSTTLGMILNVINPSGGSWKWFGKNPDTDSLKKVGAIIERPNFYPYLSARKNLEIVAEIKEIPFSKINEKLELVGLLERKKDRFETFSLGMKQRLAIAGALLNDPQVLILDEPTNGLDPQGIIQIRQIIQKIAATGTTIILASHLLDEVEKVCSHVVILNKGRTVYSGSVETMSAGSGFFELGAEDSDSLVSALHSLPYFSKIIKDSDKITAVIENDIQPSELNKLLFEKGIYLNHLVKRKESLEQQFFNLIKKQN